jgi:hypothetical protein
MAAQSNRMGASVAPQATTRRVTDQNYSTPLTEADEAMMEAKAIVCHARQAFAQAVIEAERELAREMERAEACYRVATVVVVTTMRSVPMKRAA